MVKPGQWFSRNCYTFCSLIFSIICTSFIYHIFKFYTHQPSPTNQPNNRCLRIGEMEPQEFERLAKSGKHLETIRASEGMWTIEATGRLGNLMGEYATLYALAKWNNKQAYVVPVMHSQLAKMFKLTLPALHQETNSRIPWSIHGLHDWMTEDYKSIKGDYIKFLSTPCSWTFFHHIRDEIYREFSFHDYIKKEINEYLSKARGNRANVTFVGVHVRRGDYIHVMPNQWRGVIADKAYLDKAMGYFQNKYANVLFVVASNGMDWCKENIDTSKGDVHFAGDGKEGSPDRDFAILAHCNHTIMTIGTFGFWVSYLVGGETIYLTNYTLPDSAFLKVFRYEAAFLPEWIGIPADLSPLLKKP